MAAVLVLDKWPVLRRHEQAAEWLSIWADLGRAPRTIDAYARGLAEYLEVCEHNDIDPVAATRAQVAEFVRDLRTRPSRRGSNVVALDSGSGLANATLQQRLVPVRLFYDFLVEEGARESNPVGRGRYAPGRRFGAAGGSGRGLVPRMVTTHKTVRRVVRAHEAGGVAHPYTMNTIVELKLTDGRTVQTRTTYGTSDPNAQQRGSSRAVRFDAVSDKDYVAKFRNSVQSVFTPQAADALVIAVESLDSNERIGQIFSLVREVGEGASLLN